MLLAKKVKDQDKAWNQQPQQQQYPSVRILANDWNPKAIEYMKRSIVTNGLHKTKSSEGSTPSSHDFELSCKDSYDFLSELGAEEPKNTDLVKKQQLLGSKKRVAAAGESSAKPRKQSQQPLPKLMPDHILMNFPLEAPQFLAALRWWSWKRLRDESIHRAKLAGLSIPKSATKSKDCVHSWAPRFHVYTFARASTPRADDEEEMAINIVAEQLFPFWEASNNREDDVDNENETNDDDSVVYLRDELDDKFGMDFSTRMVRDVAPGKVVVCVSFNATPKLIRYIQGDY